MGYCTVSSTMFMKQSGVWSVSPIPVAHTLPHFIPSLQLVQVSRPLTCAL